MSLEELQSHVLRRGVTDQVVLSVFPGIDLFGRAFEELGFCVVRGPDILWGGDIHRFHPPAHHFAGVIGGSPCPDFSCLRRELESGEGRELLREFLRVVKMARPAWWCLENVPGVPDVRLDPYMVQRIDLRGTECGLRQRRLRHFQFGRLPLLPPLVVPRFDSPAVVEPAAVASEGDDAGRRGWDEFCKLQGLPGPLALPGMTLSAKYRAVGNAVPLPMGRMIARAVRDWPRLTAGGGVTLCACGCARPVVGRQLAAGPACRKRLERRRRVTADVVTELGSPVLDPSLLMV